MKRNFVRGTESKVLAVLKRNKRSSKDNFVLVYEVYNDILKEHGIYSTSLEEISENHIKYGLPSYESIVRCRRKIKEDNPELFDERVETERLNATKDYIDYALDKDLRKGDE